MRPPALLSCPAISSVRPRPHRQWPASLPASPLFPPLAHCPTLAGPRPIRSPDAAAPHCALGRSRWMERPGTGWTTANCGAGATPRTRPHSLFSGESCTRISGGLEPGLEGPLSIKADKQNQTMTSINHCFFQNISTGLMCKKALVDARPQ